MVHPDRQAEVKSGAHKERTEEWLVTGGFALLLLLGGLMVALLAGLGTAALAVAVITLAAGLLFLLYRGLGLLEKWLKGL